MMPDNIVTHKDIDELRKGIESVSQKVDQVHSALVGNDLSDDGGMVKRLKNCEDDVETLRNKIGTIEDGMIKSELYLKIIWALGGMVAASLFTYIVKIVIVK